MGDVTNRYEDFLGGRGEEDLSERERVALIEALERRARNVENMLQKRSATQEKAATDRIRYRGELINEYSALESKERMNVLDNITKMKVALTAAERDTFKSRPGVSQGYLDRARFQPGGKRDAIQSLTSSISDPGSIQPGSKISNYEFEHFFDAIIRDRRDFGMYWDPSANQGKGAVSFEPGVQVSAHTKRQLQAMGRRYEQVKKDRNEAQDQITVEINRLQALEDRVRAQPGKELTDSQLDDVQSELKTAAGRANKQLNEKDRQVGVAAREDVDDYLKGDETYNLLLSQLKTVDRKKKGHVIQSEEFLKWARARGLKVGYIAADGLYVPGRQDDTALAAFFLEARRGYRDDESARYFGGNPRTGEMVTIQYTTDKIDGFRDPAGNLYKDEDGSLVNAEELQKAREVNIENVRYQTTYDGKTYRILRSGDTVGVFGDQGRVTDEDLIREIRQQPSEPTYVIGEDGKPQLASAQNRNLWKSAGTRSALIEATEDSVAKAALNKDFDLIDPSVMVPEGMTRLTEAEVQTTLREGSGFSVTESAFVLAPNASDLMTHPGKTRYRTVGGKEVIFADDELLVKEPLANFRKDRATVGELARLGGNKRSIRRMRRNADIAASQGNEQAKGWLQRQADSIAESNEARIEQFEAEKIEAKYDLPVEDEAILSQTLTPIETEDDTALGTPPEDDRWPTAFGDWRSPAYTPEPSDTEGEDEYITPEQKAKIEEAAEESGIPGREGYVSGTAEPKFRERENVLTTTGLEGQEGTTPGSEQAKADLPPPLPEEVVADLLEVPEPEEVDLTDPTVWGGPKPEEVDLTDPMVWGEPKSREDKIGLFGRMRRARQAKRQEKRDALAAAPWGE